MSTLLGFIQTLLMLTQSRLMPDLSQFFGPEPVVSSVAAYTGVGGQVKNMAVCMSYTEGVQRRSKDELLPPVSDNRKDLFRRSQPCSVRTDRKPGITKLYLFFCQLKTEG